MPRSHYVVNVSDLAWPGSLGNRTPECLLERHVGYLTRPREPGASTPSWSELRTANEAFIEGKSSEELRACPLHRINWGLACWVAVSIVRGQHSAVRSDWDGWAGTDGERHEALKLAFELLDTYKPLKHDVGDVGVENGNHRLCAMKAQGVAETVVYGYQS